MTMALTHLRDVLAVRDFRRLYATRILGQAADGLLQAALATFVLFSPERQPTAASVAGAFAVLFLPYSLVGPFAGVFLDRWRRRQVLVFANLIRALIVIAVATLIGLRMLQVRGDAAFALVLVWAFVGIAIRAGLPGILPYGALIAAALLLGGAVGRMARPNPAL